MIFATVASEELHLLNRWLILAFVNNFEFCWIFIRTFQVFYPSSILYGDFGGDVTYCFLSDKSVAPLEPLTRCSFQCPCVGPQCLEAFLYFASNNVSKNWKLCELFVQTVWPKIHWLEILHLSKCMDVLKFFFQQFLKKILLLCISIESNKHSESLLQSNNFSFNLFNH